MNLFDTQNLSPKDLFKGDLCYYADGHAVEARLTHLLQVTKVVTVTDKSIILDNGRKFSIESGEEVTRGVKGLLYPYIYGTIAMVTEAQQKLSLLNDVESVDFSTLTSQQLSMIKDVARGAFTQVLNPSPCGGCGDTVRVAGIDIETAQAPEVSATIAFNDATYELTQEELDDIEEADDDDEVGYDGEDDEALKEYQA